MRKQRAGNGNKLRWRRRRETAARGGAGGNSQAVDLASGGVAGVAFP